MNQDEHRIPKSGEVWRHYKGPLYTIVGMGHDEEGMPQVIYTDYDAAFTPLPPLYSQDLGRFLQHVEEESLMKTKVKLPRFRVEDDRSDDRCPYFR